MQFPPQQQGQQQQQGMFGNNSTYTPAHNPVQQASQQYDTSGLQAGANMINQNRVNIPNYNAFQFKNPQFSDVGNYGTDDQSMWSNLRNSAFKAGVSPIIAQSKARMDELNKGFGGNQMSGAASKQLQLRNAQATGQDVQGLSNQLSNNMFQNQANENQVARGADYQTKMAMMGATQNNQLNQSNANWQAAGYNADASTKMAADAITRANTMFQSGLQIPFMQAALNNFGMQPWNNQQDWAKTGAFQTIPPGTNLQST